MTVGSLTWRTRTMRHINVTAGPAPARLPVKFAGSPTQFASGLPRAQSKPGGPNDARRPGRVSRMATPFADAVFTRGQRGLGGSPAVRAAERRALARLIAKAVRKKAGGPLAQAGQIVADLVWQKFGDPEGFPGWGNFPESWTSNPGAPWPGIELGDYTINGFDTGPWSGAVHNLVDMADGDIFGRRYWGHFHAAEPLNAPGSTARGDDWPAPKTFVMTRTATQTRTQTLYQKLPNLAEPLTATQGGRGNIQIAIRIGARDPINVKRDVPRVRDRGDKATPANAFVYGMLRLLADSLGETREWVDIFAKATGYIRGSMMLPKNLRNTGNEVQAKLYWLFVVTGVNSIDWEQLAMLVVENEIEDRIYGFLGQLSKSAAQSLNLTVGPQTGLVM